MQRTNSSFSNSVTERDTMAFPTVRNTVNLKVEPGTHIGVIGAHAIDIVNNCPHIKYVGFKFNDVVLVVRSGMTLGEINSTYSDQSKTGTFTQLDGN